MSAKNLANIFGVRIDRLNWSELLEFCQTALLGETPKHIVTVNGEILLKAQNNPHYSAVINSADLIIPDSTNVAWVLAMKGWPVTDITPGADLVDKLAKLAVLNHKSIYLIGGREGVAIKAGEKLQLDNPGLKIAGASNINPDDLSSIKDIRDSRADIVLVAYGAPKQEEWIAAHKHELNAKLLIGVGGTFDMLTGLTPRAPSWLRQLHLEWLWRLVIEPSRFGRIWKAVVIFPLKALF